MKRTVNRQVKAQCEEDEGTDLEYSDHNLCITQCCRSEVDHLFNALNGARASNGQLKWSGLHFLDHPRVC